MRVRREVEVVEVMKVEVEVVWMWLSLSGGIWWWQDLIKVGL
jgi:hypothetical protein